MSNNNFSSIDNKILEKLKLERQIFPSCIQAPLTYFNKRKSSDLSCKRYKNKSPVFLGEQIESNNRSHQVQQWLMQQDKIDPVRTPLTDVNVNIQAKKHSTKYYDTNNRNSKENIKKHKRKSQSKISSARKKNLSLKKQFENTSNWQSLRMVDPKHSVSINDESGIVLDESDSLINFTADDETIVIEDSQTEIIDKDKQALLAVIEADQNYNRIGEQRELLEYSNLDTLANISSETVNRLNKAAKNVPFYKRSSLINICNSTNDGEYSQPNIKQKDVFVTILTENYVTSVSIKQNVLSDSKMNAVSVQTDLTDFNLKPLENSLVLSKNNKSALESLKKRSIIISDSSSDGYDDNNLQNIPPTSSSSLCVRSALAELHDFRSNKSTKRQRKSTGSSDSSEKENCDPNRMKKIKMQKCIKKKPFLRF